MPNSDLTPTSDSSQSRITYTIPGDGSTTLFPVLWPFLDRDYVHVSLENPDDPASKELSGNDLTWVNETWIELTPAPAKGVGITISRITPSDRPLVTFEDGAMQTADAHNTAITQLLHVLAEERDFIRRWLDLESHLRTLSTLSVAVETVPDGQAASASYNPTTNMLTLRLPTGQECSFCIQPPISDSVTSPDSGVYASSKAVKIAYDKAVEATQPPEASPTVSGVVPKGGAAGQMYKVNAAGTAYGWEDAETIPTATPTKAGLAPSGGKAGDVYQVDKTGTVCGWGPPALATPMAPGAVPSGGTLGQVFQVLSETTYGWGDAPAAERTLDGEEVSVKLTTSGVFTAPVDGQYTLDLFGGGGGGGGAGWWKETFGGGGGGGGGAGGHRRLVLDFKEGDEIPITIGAGGAGGAASPKASSGYGGGGGGETTILYQGTTHSAGGGGGGGGGGNTNDSYFAGGGGGGGGGGPSGTGGTGTKPAQTLVGGTGGTGGGGGGAGGPGGSRANGGGGAAGLGGASGGGGGGVGQRGMYDSQPPSSGGTGGSAHTTNNLGVSLTCGGGGVGGANAGTRNGSNGQNGGIFITYQKYI